MKKSIQIGFVLGFASLAFAGQLSKDLPPGNSSAPVTVIVQFKTPPTKAELQQLVRPVEKNLQLDQGRYRDCFPQSSCGAESRSERQIRIAEPGAAELS